MRLLPFLLLMTLLGTLLLRLFLFKAQDKPIPDGSKISFVTRLAASPKVKGASQTFLVHQPGYEPFLVTTASTPRLFYGEKLRITGSVKLKMLGTGKPVKTMYFPTITSLPEQGILYSLRSQITHSFEDVLPLDQARLLLGIVFGIKEPLSPVFQAQIQTVGLLHVIAASGMNVTLLVSGLLFVLGRFLPRREAICLSLIGILFYALLAGLQASIVRASIMGGLALTASLLGRQYFGLWALLLTGYVMLLLSPATLTDVGFQLSFLATAGIMLIKPLVGFTLPKPFQVVQEDLTTTMSAQLGTVPILLIAFGQFNLLSLLVNALVLWMVAPLMILGGIAALTSFFLQPVTIFLLYLCLPLLFLFQTVVAFFAQYPILVGGSFFSPRFMIAYHLLLCLLIYFFSRRKRLHEQKTHIHH